jgi:hypothetical protein
VFSVKGPIEEPIRGRLENLQSSKIQLLVKYWKSRQPSKDTPPLKTDLDPLDLGQLGLLPALWLVEAEPTGMLRYRLAGENINNIFKRSLRGLTINEIFDPATAEKVTRRWHRVLDEGLATYSVGNVYPENSAPYRGERLVLPALDHEGAPTFIMGITDYYFSDAASQDANISEFDTPLAYFVPIRDL